MASIFVIAAICGNFWHESTLNPGIWESLQAQTSWEVLGHGYGFGQWTNTGGDNHGRLYRLHQYLSENGYADDSAEGQLNFITYENRWLPSDEYGNAFSSLSDFLSSTSDDLTLLTHAWTNAWEGIHGSSWDARVEYAGRCYTYILEHSEDASITEWKSGNRYLSENDRLNNAVMIYRYLGGDTPPTPPPGPDPPGPQPQGGTKHRMPVWMMTKKRRFIRWQ